jgi:hypothetical protein
MMAQQVNSNWVDPEKRLFKSHVREENERKNLGGAIAY